MFCLSLSNVCKEIAQCVNKSPFFSLCLDVSNDVTKTAQIIVCVRYFDVDENLFRERHLCLAYLTERPYAKNLYTAVKWGLDFLNVSTKNTCAITADGAQQWRAKEIEYWVCLIRKVTVIYSAFTVSFTKKCLSYKQYYGWRRINSEESNQFNQYQQHPQK
jgi:hypothetical protein